MTQCNPKYGLVAVAHAVKVLPNALIAKANSSSNAHNNQLFVIQMPIPSVVNNATYFIRTQAKVIKLMVEVVHHSIIIRGDGVELAPLRDMWGMKYRDLCTIRHCSRLDAIIPLSTPYHTAIQLPDAYGAFRIIPQSGKLTPTTVLLWIACY